MTLRVLLVDDDALVRSALRRVLAGEADIEVVGEADDGPQALSAVREHSPDMVLMDLQMPGTDGLEATEVIVADQLRRGPPRAGRRRSC